MALPIDYFQPQTFAQSNPFIAGFGAGQGLITQGLQNQQMGLNNQILGVNAQYAQPMAQQNLLNSQLNNQILQPQAQYAPQMTLADLALKQEMPKYYGALAGEAGSRAGMNYAQINLLKQQTPYLVDRAQADVYSDPMLSRANQMAMAQQAGQSNPYLSQGLGMMGLGSQGGQGGQQYSMPSPVMGGGMMPGMQQPGMQPNTMNAPRMMTGSPMQNYLMFGSPLSPYMQMQMQAYGKGLDTQQTAQANDLSKALTGANEDANLGQQMSKFADQFQQGYNNTNLTGYGMGHLPATTNASQQADNASQNLAALVAKTIAGGRVTNYEMQYVSNLKPNRAMNPETAQMTSDFLKQKSIRMQEEQPFLTAARNQGVDVYTANTLWNQYNNQRPVYDFGTKQPNAQFQGGWRNYLSPQAVQSAQMGQPYVSIPQFSNQTEAKNWFKTLNPGDRTIVKAQLGGQ